MKPKIFIGSSVEGLSAAYSIQQNLTHDAEVTVWDQGVFSLSKTTIESLLEILEKSDYGIFIFSSDDINQIRNKKVNVIRDNVLFEFGLFIGKLSRERVFFIIPIGSDLHLPTDLLGITPGFYDTNREDKSLQAATGPVSHQIRIQIQKLGLINPNEEISQEPIKESEKESENESNDNDYWREIFIKNDYLKGIVILEQELDSETEIIKIIEKKIWIAYCKLKIDPKAGASFIKEILIEHKDNVSIYKGIARIYSWDDNYTKAIKLLESALILFENDENLITLLSQYYKADDDDEKALNILIANKPEQSISISLGLVEIYNTEKEYEKAREIIHKIYLNFPDNEKIRYEYSKLSIELNQNEIALYLLDSLTKEFSDNPTYWGYLSNCCVNLSLYDIGMISCKKANELTKEEQSWLILNIGNMLKNKGFYSDSIEYFERGLIIDKYSEFGHERLAISLKAKEEERIKSKTIAKQGRKLLSEFSPKE